MYLRGGLALALLLACGCDGGRRISSPSPTAPRRDAAVVVGGDGSTNTPDPDAGAEDARVRIDAGPCMYGAVQPLSQPCCIDLGPDACALGASCAALDGRAIPVCYGNGSRRTGETCTADAQCTSGSCGTDSPRTCREPMMTGPDLRTPSAILSFIDGTELVETGADLPSHPHGLADNVNYGAASQCFVSITIAVIGRTLENHVLAGTLRNAPNAGDVGTCDHNTASTELAYSSTALLIDHVQGNGACFDIDVTYTGFGVTGRGAFEADGSRLHLEIFFRDQATGVRCADGPVGSRTVTLNGTTFTGDAVQTFQIQRR